MFTQNSYYKPFVLVKEDEKSKVKIVIGRVQATPIEFENFDAAEDYLKTQPYEMFLNLYSILNYYQDEKNNKKTEANS